MDNYVIIVNKILSLGIILLQGVILLILINFIFNYKKKNTLSLFFKKYTLHFGSVIALGSILCSLFYSEIVGFPPCNLCVIQRVFLYPQLFLFGFGFYKSKKILINSSLVLSIIGSLVSVYHILIENGLATSAICSDPSSGGVSCSIRYIYEFGYITMPVMALTLSLFIFILLINYKYTEN